MVPSSSSPHMRRREDNSPADISLVSSFGVVDDAEGVHAIAFVVADVMAAMSVARSCPAGRVVGVVGGPDDASAVLCSVGKSLPNVSFAHWHARIGAVRENALSVTYGFMSPELCVEAYSATQCGKIPSHSTSWSCV